MSTTEPPILTIVLSIVLLIVVLLIVAGIVIATKYYMYISLLSQTVYNAYVY